MNWRCSLMQMRQRAFPVLYYMKLFKFVFFIVRFLNYYLISDYIIITKMDNTIC